MANQIINSTDPIYGAIGNGNSYPLSAIAAFSGITSLSALAAVTTFGGATPYSWVTNSLYGLTFTKTTSAQTTSGTTLTFSNLSGDLANPAQYLVPGMLVVGTNIPANTTISSIAFTLSTPNAASGPVAGTITISNAVSATVANGATITFTYSGTMIQALQMDWLGIQAAEYACGLAAPGCRHHTPAGNYQINRTIIRSDTPSGSFQTNQSSWFGDGMIPTRLTWITDLNYGAWAVSPANRTTTGNVAYSEMQEMSLWGPGNITTMGIPGCGMHGLAVSSGFFGFRLSCRNFYSGLNLVNDHQNFIECYFQSNFWNVYFAPYTAGSTGNQRFIDCHFDTSNGASICCSGYNQIANASFISGQLGYAPYGIYKEYGTQTNFLINSLFSGLNLDSCGNGGIYDSNSTGLVLGCEFSEFEISLDTTNTYRITGNSTYAAIYVGYMEYCWFHGPTDPYTSGYNRGTAPYSLAIIAAQAQINNCKFWNVTNLLAVGSSTFPSVYSYYGITGADVQWDSGAASGNFRSVSGAITSGVFVSMTTSGAAIALSSTNPAVVGLALQAATGSVAGQCIPICSNGLAVANKTNTTDVIAAGNYVQTHSSTDGSVVAFNSSARTNTVGIVSIPTTNSQTTLTLEVSLKGP